MFCLEIFSSDITVLGTERGKKAQAIGGRGFAHSGWSTQIDLLVRGVTPPLSFPAICPGLGDSVFSPLWRMNLPSLLGGGGAAAQLCLAEKEI